MKRFCIHGHDTARCGRAKDGMCRKCINILIDKWRDKNPEKAKIYWRKYQATNPERKRASHRKWSGCKNCPPEYKDQKCMICGSKPNIALCADHNHSNGLFRGWLCQKCNAGLGMFNDNLKLLKKATKYLSSNSTNN